MSARRAAPAEPLTLDAFRSENRKTGPSRCGLNEFVRAMSPGDRATLAGALRDESVQAQAIFRVLRSRGFALTSQVITRHRRLGCRFCEEAGWLPKT